MPDQDEDDNAAAAATTTSCYTTSPVFLTTRPIWASKILEWAGTFSFACILLLTNVYLAGHF